MNNHSSVDGEVETLSVLLQQLLSRKRNTDVEIRDLRRVSGGASHETWAFSARCENKTDALVLRRDFHQPLIDGDIVDEFELLRALTTAALPVPHPYYCDGNGGVLETPWMIVEAVDGTDLRKAMARRLDPQVRETLGRNLVELQATIHSLGVEQFPNLAARTPADEIRRWSKPLAVERTSRPLLVAAASWLRDQAPPPQTSVLVHGDFKANNLLIDDRGEVTVIDWEMAHCGDPLEDLAWTMLWSTQDDLVGGLLTRETYLKTYAEFSGKKIDEMRLCFWEIFALLKLAGIFISGAPDSDDRVVRPSCIQLRRALPWVEAKLAEKLATRVSQAQNQ